MRPYKSGSTEPAMGLPDDDVIQPLNASIENTTGSSVESPSALLSNGVKESRFRRGVCSSMASCHSLSASRFAKKVQFVGINLKKCPRIASVEKITLNDQNHQVVPNMPDMISDPDKRLKTDTVFQTNCEGSRSNARFNTLSEIPPINEIEVNRLCGARITKPTALSVPLGSLIERIKAIAAKKIASAVIPTLAVVEAMAICAEKPGT